MRDVFMSRPVARVKALTDADAPGTFEAIVSVFGNEDSDGDVVMPGAFTKTLAANPNPPVVYSHDWLSVPIGQTLEAKETNEGLYVRCRLFVGDDEQHARAREVYAAMRGGALREFSFGGRVTSETRVERDDGSVIWQLNEIDLAEHGPCLKGANDRTRLMAIKAMIKSGRIDADEVRAALDGPAPEPAPEPAPQPAGDDSPTTSEPAPPEAPQDDPTPDVEVTPAPPQTDVPAPEVDVTGPQEVSAEGRALRSLLGLPADAAEPELLIALGERATPTPTPSVRGGDPEQREHVAELLLP